MKPLGLLLNNYLWVPLLIDNIIKSDTFSNDIIVFKTIFLVFVFTVFSRESQVGFLWTLVRRNIFFIPLSTYAVATLLFSVILCWH